MFSVLILSALALGVNAWTAPEGWTKRQAAPLDGPIRLSFALKLEDGGYNAVEQLQKLSHPGRPAYRQWLTSEQTSMLARPHLESKDVVEQWLAEHGLSESASLDNSIIHVDATVQQAQDLLDATYYTFTDGTRDIIRTDSFNLPEDVATWIDFVAPTTQFPKASRPHNKAERRSLEPRSLNQPRGLSARDSCGAEDNTTPTCVRQIYDINYTAKPNRTFFAVYATEGASYSASDLQKYLQTYNQPAAQANATFEVIGDGDPAEKSGGIESAFETSLDTQTSLGLAWPAQGIVYQRGGVFGPDPGQTYDFFVQFLSELIKNTSVPSVVTFSESMPEDQVDPAYAQRLCSMMAQVGTKGITLLFSSGDNGPNGDVPTGVHKQVFEPEFPASCPWVTSVGGTTNMANETGATNSTIPATNKVSFIASGGGFSNYFAAPDYQSNVTSSYISQHVPSSYKSVSGFNASGRGIPDVSAFSTNFPTVADGLSVPIGGTSASTPLWAAIITLLNDYEASKGRPALGFVNPWLYSLKSGLKDITTGGNSQGGCDAAQNCTLNETLGYDVTVGWDPVTGLGSPIFSQLTAALDAAAAGNGTLPGSNSTTTSSSPSGTSPTSSSSPSSSTHANYAPGMRFSESSGVSVGFALFAFAAIWFM